MIRFRSLKSRLLLGLSILLLVLAAVMLGLTWQVGKNMLQASNVTHLRYEANILADELTQQVENRIDALQRFSSAIGAADDAAWVQYELAKNDSLLSWFDGVVVSNEAGTIIADWPSVIGRVGLETGDSENFKMLRGTRTPYVSEPFLGRVSNEPLVVIGVPRLNGDGEFRGTVGGIVRLNSGGLFNRLAKIRLGDDGYSAIFTASGRILFHPDKTLVNTAVSSLDDHPWLDSALDGWEGDGLGNLLNGQSAYQSYSQVWPANWVVGLYLPVEQAQAPLSDFIYRLWWIWLALALLLMPLLWWLLARILSPLNRLEAQIDEVGRAERSHVNLATSMHELQEVANTFNRVEDERQQLLNNLHEREAFLDSVLNSSPEGMFVANFDGVITYMNPALLMMLDIPKETLMEAWLKQIHPDDYQGAVDLWQHSLKSGKDYIRQLRFIKSDSEILWLDIHARVVMLSQSGHSLGLVGVVKDITERRQQEALQRWEAEHDPLTGLLNRRGFLRRLDEAYADFQKTSTPSALLLFDLDHFKPINDEGGHALGDEMLRRIAQVIAWEVRRSDHVARQGGDEFGVLLPSCTLTQAQRIAESLRQAVSEVSVTHADKVYTVTLSMGVTRFNDEDDSVEDALNRADAASYEAKSRGRNDVVVSNPSEFDPMTLF
ncbi:diguanylate cyclase domain-containing protein [Halomonas sp. GD1P12]|uniref:sensor domain-containing diguanylate cyclase n=1 Tax=Halomonas sp. GD1P12 TaxID=2982691 RepID=UPI0021E385D0|nr:diguanylate cyclase [Halomonas sp. GD1P12]UYG01688.1 diguanylate cyclase [Halomonas sp. GD1P12]